MSGYLPITDERMDQVLSSPLIIVSGVLITLYGFDLDGQWHAQGGLHEEVIIPPGHAVVLVGTALLLAGALRLYRRTGGRQQTASGIAVAGAGGSLISRTVDDILHGTGIHGSGLNQIAHVLDKVGVIVFLLAIIVVALFGLWKRLGGDDDGDEDTS